MKILLPGPLKYCTWLLYFFPEPLIFGNSGKLSTEMSERSEGGEEVSGVPDKTCDISVAFQIWSIFEADILQQAGVETRDGMNHPGLLYNG